MNYLIADDDLVSRLALAHHISSLPEAKIIQVEDGVAAWDALQSMELPVMCLLDIQMPGMTGIEVLKKVRENRRFTGWPAMLITGTADRDSVSEASQLNVSGFVVKPIGQDAVARVGAIAQQFQISILEPFPITSSRLGIDWPRYQTYIGALLKQLDTLVHEMNNANENALAALSQLTDTCRTAAVTLGSRHLEMVINRLLSTNGSEPATVVQQYGQAISLIHRQIQRQAGLA
jgi:two-component system chemotaxis response regulator CheY